MPSLDVDVSVPIGVLEGHALDAAVDVDRLSRPGRAAVGILLEQPVDDRLDGVGIVARGPEPADTLVAVAVFAVDDGTREVEYENLS